MLMNIVNVHELYRPMMSISLNQQINYRMQIESLCNFPDILFIKKIGPRSKFSYGNYRKFDFYTVGQ